MAAIYTWFEQLLVGNGLIIAGGMWVFGQIIKQWIPKWDNRLIPLICGGTGGVCGLLLLGIFGEQDIFIAIVNGIVLGWGATGGFETFKNWGKIHDGDNPNYDSENQGGSGE